VSPSEGLRIEGLDVDYGRTPVLRDLRLEVLPGAPVALIGPNGSGKTTLLRAIVGLEPIGRGRILLDGVDLARVPTHRRGIGLLFQEPALFPGRSVEENVAYGLDLAHWPRSEADARVRGLLQRLGIAPLAHRPSEALSGGERQRVALARTLAPRPKAVLLDEPFAAVDPELRSALREEFGAVLRAEGVAALHVTHDPEEALAVGERIVLLREGRIAQQGPAEEVFRAPVDVAAARFLGYQIVPWEGRTVAVHPREWLRDDGPDGWPATVEAVRPSLGERLVRVRLSAGPIVEWRVGASEPDAIVPGTRVRLRPRRPVAFPNSA